MGIGDWGEVEVWDVESEGCGGSGCAEVGLVFGVGGFAKADAGEAKGKVSVCLVELTEKVGLFVGFEEGGFDLVIKVGACFID